MKTRVAIGTAGLDDKDLVVLKSALKLRSEDWTWVDAPQHADVWVADGTRAGEAALDPQRLVVMVDDPLRSLPGIAAHVLGKPLKAVQLMRVLDKLLAAGASLAPPTARPAPQPAPAAAVVEEVPAIHPWRGRRLRLLRQPSLSRYPVTAEMLVWLQSMARKPVAYDALVEALPLDGELLHTILEAAAQDGHLVDETGAALAPLAARREGVMARVFGKR